MRSTSRERRRKKSFEPFKYMNNKVGNFINNHHNPLLSKKAGNNALRKSNLLHIQREKLMKKIRNIDARSGKPNSSRSNRTRRMTNL
jgi:hypothetical protein